MSRTQLDEGPLDPLGAPPPRDYGPLSEVGISPAIARHG